MASLEAHVIVALDQAGSLHQELVEGLQGWKIFKETSRELLLELWHLIYCFGWAFYLQELVQKRIDIKPPSNLILHNLLSTECRK